MTSGGSVPWGRTQCQRNSVWWFPTKTAVLSTAATSPFSKLSPAVQSPSKPTAPRDLKARLWWDDSAGKSLCPNNLKTWVRSPDSAFNKNSEEEFLRILHIAIQGGCAKLRSHQWWMWFLFLYNHSSARLSVVLSHSDRGEMKGQCCCNLYFLNC